MWGWIAGRLGATTLDDAYAANPTRFRHRQPEPPELLSIAWINEPTEDLAQNP